VAEEWLPDARKASQSREAFEQNYHLLPGKIKSLLKHVDPRAKSSRNVDKELAELSEDGQKVIPSLLKYHQAFPLKHDYPKPRHHESKYKGKARNMNHLIGREELKRFDKRGS
jgi:hypothetical protein